MLNNGGNLVVCVSWDTTQFLPLFNIDNQRNNNSGQMFSAQWVMSYLNFLDGYDTLP